MDPASSLVPGTLNRLRSNDLTPFHWKEGRYAVPAGRGEVVSRERESPKERAVSKRNSASRFSDTRYKIPKYKRCPITWLCAHTQSIRTSDGRGNIAKFLEVGTPTSEVPTLESPLLRDLREGSRMGGGRVCFPIAEGIAVQRVRGARESWAL